jgi:hypothetical protein
MKKNKYLFLDFNGVLATANQFDSIKTHFKYNCYPFDKKCVRVLNEVIVKTSAIIIVTSDWKYHYGLEALNEIFKWNNIIEPVSYITKSFWGTKFKSVEDLEHCRATEIIDFVETHNLTNNKWVAIDDLDLSPFLSKEHFVQTPRVYEGIKQSGIKDKIIKRLR